MRIRGDLVLIAVFVAWTVAAHRLAHLVVAPGEFPPDIVDRAEDVATLAGGLGLVVLGMRHVRAQTRAREEAVARSERALRARVDQQAAVAALGQMALDGAASRELAREAAETVRRTLHADAGNVLEHLPREGAFRIRATSGFDQAVVDGVVALDGARSMSGYTVMTGRPLFLTDWRTETRFRPSRFLLERGIVSVATTPIRGDGRPFGVLSVCTRTPREFTQDDAAFLSSVANVLAATLQRERIADAANRFFDLSQDLLAITDFDGLIRRANPALVRTVGDGSDPVGRPFLEFVHPEDRELSRVDRLVAPDRPTAAVENRCVAPDGTYRRLEWTVQTDAERGLVYCVARDVTDRRRMESDHALLARTIEQAAETIVVTGPDAAIRYVNPAFERVTGWTRAEVVGRNPSILKSGRQGPAFYARMWATLVGGEVWSGRLVNRKKDGSTYQADGTIAPMRDAEGRLVNYVAVMRDVTREAALEAQFHQAQKMEVVGQLAGGVAHDFNNLLCVIEGYGSLLLEELPAADPLRGHVAQIRVASRNAALLTRQLLAFSRKQDMQPRVLDLNVVVRDAAKMWTRLLGEDVRLVTRFSGALGRVRADPGQMDQVLMNLAVNARDAMAGGGVLTIETANVTLDAAFVALRAGAREGRFVRLSVCDTGVGMDAATLSHVFEPFFTTKAPGKGTGLGLATVYGIVKQSDGYVEAESEPGRGSSFHLYLPRVDSDVAAEDLTPADDGARAPGGSETLLVLEDDPAVRRLMCEVLRGAGYAVVASGGAAEAVAASRSHQGPVALLVADVVLPDADGPEAARRIAAERPSIRVLFVSGHTFETMSRRGVIDEHVDLLLKPFRPDALLRRVRAAIDAPAPRRDACPSA